MPTFPRRAAIALLAFLSTCSIAADTMPAAEQRGPQLAAASNFGHGWNAQLFDQAIAFGVRDFRDIVYWNSVETEKGDYVFDEGALNYPLAIEAAGAGMSLTVNWGNDLYDEGYTPYTPDGRAALGDFVVATLDAFPAIDTVEVGNEFNGQNFVDGPIRDSVRDDRAAEHFELLKAVYGAVKAKRPDVAVLGGATHSLPLSYLWSLMDQGGGAYMDALAVHPYTTAPEHLVRQIEVFRRNAASRDVPLQVTEFGDPDPETAPGFLVRMYCAMALAGVTRSVWYPLNARGDSMQPLVDEKTGQATGVGRAFSFVDENFVGKKVRDVSPDPFTYACLFDERKLVIWGEPRDVILASDATVTDVMGTKIGHDGLRLSMTNPLIVSSDEPIEFGRTLSLSKNRIVADSYHQFSYPEEDKRYAKEDPFRRFVERGDRSVRLYVMPGQDGPGTPWTPYLGNRFLRPVRVTEDAIVPAGTSEDPKNVVVRYRAAEAADLQVKAKWNPAEHSTDGVDLTVRLNEMPLLVQTGLKIAQDVTLPKVVLKKGDRLDFVLGPGGNSDGDIVGYRIQLISND